MATLQNIEKIASLLVDNSVCRNTSAQAKARYILYGVQEDEANFPRFNVDLTIKAGQISFLCFEIACTYYEKQDKENASIFYAKGAELLEHCYFKEKNTEESSDFYILIASLAYYCANQYSKAYVLISRSSYNTPITQLLSFFLSRQIDKLEETIKTILIPVKEPSQDYVYQNIIARALSQIILFYREGDRHLFEEASKLLDYACKYALLSDEPSIWWLIRLLRIIIANIPLSSFWFQLHDEDFIADVNDPGLEEQQLYAKETVEKYIRTLAFRHKTPVYELFVSQRKALRNVLKDSGAVVSMPTSSGKTRIAEISILQALISDPSSKVLYIAPFRSLSFEMEESLFQVFNPIGFSVTHLYGGSQFTSIDRAELESSRILIATPEKAKAIMRTNENTVGAIRLVVMDEGHLLGTGEREIANEMFTEELRRIVKQNDGKFLVLSAVLPNAEDMALWLAKSRDNVVKSQWRPSTQRLGKIIYTTNRIDIEWLDKDYPCFNRGFVCEKKDKKELVALTALKLSSLGSVLLYCPQKRMVLSNADIMYSLLRNTPDIDWGNDVDWRCFELVCEETITGQHYLDLAKKGILCHCASLNNDMRKYTERLLRKGKAKFIYATNTLAQGVNLGVSTVIIMGVNQGNGNITNRDFWNMAGRAGRSFVDTEGKILYVVDCTGEKWQTDWRQRQANNYLCNLQLDEVQSGVCQLLKAIARIPEEVGMPMEDFLQLIAEDKLETVLPDVTRYLELIDDSLLSMDFAYRDNPTDEITWVENHFCDSIAIIQENDDELRKLYYQIIKARVKAVRSMTLDNDLPHSFASSGLPLKAVLFIEDKLDEIRTLAYTYLESDQRVENKETIINHLDRIILEIPSSRIKKYNAEELDVIRNPWIEGKELPSSVKNAEDIALYYYNYTASWVMNALANIFASQKEEELKNVFEELSLVVSNGLPSRWAVKVYQSGISSRLIASEFAERIVEPIEIRVTEVVDYLRTAVNESDVKDQLSDQAKKWATLIQKVYIGNRTKRIRFPRFQFSNQRYESLYKPLYCKSFEGSTYLCTEDYKIKISVKDTRNLRFSSIADIPGLTFVNDEGIWNLKSINPFIEVE